MVSARGAFLSQSPRADHHRIWTGRRSEISSALTEDVTRYEPVTRAVSERKFASAHQSHNRFVIGLQGDCCLQQWESSELDAEGRGLERSMLCLCGGSSSVDEDETTGGGTRSSKQARGRRTFEPGSRILQTGRRVTVSELDLLKSKSAVTSTLRGLLKDSMGQVTDAAPLSRATRARAACHPCSVVTVALPHVPSYALHIAALLSQILPRRVLVGEPRVLARRAGQRSPHSPALTPTLPTLPL